MIASDISGNRDLVSHGVDGILFDSDSDEQLADGVLSLMNAAGMRDEMGVNARSKVLEHYQIHDRVERMAQAADVAVVLGGGGGSRLRKGLELYEQGIVGGLVLVDEKEKYWDTRLVRQCPDCKTGG